MPDINGTGRAFYTLAYERPLRPLPPLADGHRRCAGAGGAPRAATRAWLRLAGVNWRLASATLDGAALLPAGGDIPGAFRRRWLDVTAAKELGGSVVTVVVEPPEHPGDVNCTRVRMDKPDVPCGQGGDHAMAQDAAAPQFTAGWDWMAPMPDRSTGLIGAVEHVLTGDVVLRDPAVVTRRLDAALGGEGPGEWRAEVVSPAARWLAAAAVLPPRAIAR